MAFLDSWRAVSARIKGLLALSQSSLLPNGDMIGSWTDVADQCAQIGESLEGFAEGFELSLPPDLQKRILEAGKNIRADIDRTEGQTREFKRDKIRHVLFKIGILETEVSFRLTDTQASLKARSELAFSHLHRLIVVDEDVRKKWGAAFKVGEVACEKLGAVHLLAHGIWAFKAHSEGERTDLVFQEPNRDLEQAAMFAEGLVLTEWKKLKVGANPDMAFAQARQQAGEYTRGSLAGSDLRGYRFAIVVSQETHTPPPDFEERGVTWRHVNIAVNPETPLKRSRGRQR